MQKNCCCPPEKITWNEIGPESVHQYRVECGYCRTFIKWGKQSELDSLSSDYDVTVKAYAAPRPDATLDGFLS